MEITALVVCLHLTEIVYVWLVPLRGECSEYLGSAYNRVMHRPALKALPLHTQTISAKFRQTTRAVIIYIDCVRKLLFWFSALRSGYHCLSEPRGNTIWLSPAPPWSEHEWAGIYTRPRKGLVMRAAIFAKQERICRQKTGENGLRTSEIYRVSLTVCS
jgi:hypothetical protein